MIEQIGGFIGMLAAEVRNLFPRKPEEPMMRLFLSPVDSSFPPTMADLARFTEVKSISTAWFTADECCGGTCENGCWSE